MTAVGTILKGCSGERLDSIDAQRFTSSGMNISSHVQDAYIQFQAGLIDKEVSEAERGILAVCLTQPGAKISQTRFFFVPEAVCCAPCF
jgi:hypothetical protein